MNENDKIKDLESQAKNTKHFIDRLNRAFYGMTWEEHERLHGNSENDDNSNNHTKEG